jgi:hypothetical protein
VRRSIPFLVLLLATTSCSGGPDRSSSGPDTGSAPSDQMANSAADASASFAPPPGIVASRASQEAGPNVGPTAAPGVAFNYRYAFRLAAPRIAEVQERHAAMCEQLTVARCRITGMHYRVVNDRDIEAMLAFKLDPAAARQFGREAIGVVVQHEGMLTESEISGVDVGTSIRAAGRGIAELEADLARIEARLRQGVPAGERSQLTYDAEQLRAQIRSIRASRDQQQESLATTPMIFRYGSGGLVPGFAPRPTLRQALDNAGEGFLDGAYILLRILIALLPWALTLGLIAWIVALIRRRWFRKAPVAAPEPEASAG